MALLLAPYNNGMRLGQGFNSYTQEICIDDAVVIDPDRAENVLTNDGTTMRILAENNNKPSLWNRQKEVVSDDRAARKALAESQKGQKQLKAKEDASEEDPNSDGDGSAFEEVHPLKKQAPAKRESDSEEPEAQADNETKPEPRKAPETAQDEDADPTDRKSQKDKLISRRQLAREEQIRRQRKERERLEEARKYRLEVEKERREDEKKRRQEEREELSSIRREEREAATERRKAVRESINKAASAKSEPLSLEELNKIIAQNQFADRFAGMGADDEEFTMDPSGAPGTSQTVVYSSRFIDKLSDITDDMCISGALTVKASKIGGSGRGSFVDSDKFKSSDLNFYISVKVINQTVNFKDALVYNPLPNMRDPTAEEFRKIYGDSYISGFIEGGEFNAVVSMKVLNKAKMMDIKAEAKVALTAGPVDIEAQANVGIARSNVETNTETTIQVSWCGGGHIKPMEQQWNIQSLMAAASRFPDLVAACPQRTHAILHKYETLRSFAALKPAQFSPIQYENAQLYTGMLMDAFMSYKTLYKTIGEQIFNVQKELLEFEPVPEISKPRFEATLTGLADARRQIRLQMNKIVTEVDFVEKRPADVCSPDHQEPFESPVAFEESLPKLKTPEQLLRKSEPLTGKRMMAKTQTEQEMKDENDAQKKLNESGPLIPEGTTLVQQDQAAMDQIIADYPGIGRFFNVSSSVGGGTDTNKGELFNSLEFLQQDWHVRSITIQVEDGAVCSIGIDYGNRLVLAMGKAVGSNMTVRQLRDFGPAERIVSAAIENGVRDGQPSDYRILSLRLFTNRGRYLLGQATVTESLDGGKVKKDGIIYGNVKTTYLDCYRSNSSFSGIFGKLNEQGNAFQRLGIVWGTTSKAASTTATDSHAPVFEVNKPTQSPSVGGDEHDKNVQLAAQLAAVQNVKLDLEKKLTEQKQQWNDAIQRANNLTDENKGLTQTNLSLSEDLDKIRNDPNAFALAQVGAWLAKDWKDNPSLSATGLALYSHFSPTYNRSPQILTGLSRISIAKFEPFNFRSSIEWLDHAGVKLAGSSAGRTWEGRISWMALPQNKIQIESGRWDSARADRFTPTSTVGTPVPLRRRCSTRITFSRPFARQPRVVAWISSINMKGNQYRSFKIDVESLNLRSFDLVGSTTENSSFEDFVIEWIALDDVGSSTKASVGYVPLKAANTPQQQWVGTPTFQTSSKPKVFLAISSFAMNDDNGIALACDALTGGGSGFHVDHGSWAGIYVESASFAYVAFE